MTVAECGRARFKAEISIAHADLINVKNWCRLSTVFHVECRVALV